MAGSPEQSNGGAASSETVAKNGDPASNESPQKARSITAPSIAESWEQCAYDALKRMRAENMNEYLIETAADVGGAAAMCWKAGPAYKLCVATGAVIGQGHALRAFQERMTAALAPARLACLEKAPMSKIQLNTAPGNRLSNDLEREAVPFPIFKSLIAPKVPRECNSTLKGCIPCQDVENGCTEEKKKKN